MGMEMPRSSSFSTSSIRSMERVGSLVGCTHRCPLAPTEKYPLLQLATSYNSLAWEVVQRVVGSQTAASVSFNSCTPPKQTGSPSKCPRYWRWGQVNSEFGDWGTCRPKWRMPPACRVHNLVNA